MHKYVEIYANKRALPQRQKLRNSMRHNPMGKKRRGRGGAARRRFSIKKYRKPVFGA